MPDLTTLAVLIAASDSGHTYDSGGGSNADILVYATGNSNSIHIINGIWYVVILVQNVVVFPDIDTGSFRIYASSDEGATWAPVGPLFTPTVSGGGMSSFVVDTHIWIGYTRSFHVPGSSTFGLVAFDTTDSTWGSENTFDCGDAGHAGTPIRAEGPYATHVRPDGSFAFLLSDTLVTQQFAVAFDGSFHGPVLLSSGDPKLFQASTRDDDGTVHIIYSQGYNPSIFYHQTFNPDNTAGTPVTVSGFTGDLLSWSDQGLQGGFRSGGTFYFSVGHKDADYPTIWGRPAILFGNDDGWTLGDELDTDGAISDFSHWASVLFLVEGTLVYYWRGISSDGSAFIDRVGYAPEGSHNTPAAWTWQTVYNLASPSPAVSGQAAPYDPWIDRGATTGLLIDGTDVRAVTTLKNADGFLFVTYLFLLTVVAAGFGNEFY